MAQAEESQIQSCGLTPISPPLVKSADLLRPVVEPRRGATVSHSVRVNAVPFSALFVSSAGFHPDAGNGSHHLLRLKLRGAKREGRETRAA